MIDNQLGRRNLPPFARIELNLKKKDILKQTAKENKKGQGISVDNVDKINVREKIAKLSKVAEGTVHKAEFIIDKVDHETKEKLRRGEETINKVYTKRQG